MILYLMRHGHATTAEQNPERPLSASGKSEVRKVGEYLKRKGIRIEMLVHSSKARAMETAHIIREAVDPMAAIERWERLAPNDSVETAAEQIRIHSIESPDHPLMVVGHLPFLPILAAKLVKKSSSGKPIQFPEAGIACLRSIDENTWELTQSIVPDGIT